MNSKKSGNHRHTSVGRYIGIAVAVFAASLVAAVLSSILLRLVMFSDEQSSVIAEMVSGIIAAIAAGLVLFELKAAEKERIRQNDIEEASFILQYNQTFIQDPNMAEVESLLEQNAFYGLESPIITKENRQKFVNYLVYLEGLAPIIMSGILKFEHIDNLMAYRFFLAVNNPELQREEILPFASYYQGCFRLYSLWADYRAEHRLDIPLKDTSLDKTEIFELTKMDLSSKNIEMRQLSQKDCLSYSQRKDIAALIYDTDQYIYPALFSGISEPRASGKTVIAELLEKNSDAMFCKDNLYIAQLDDIVVGLILCHQGDLCWDAETFMEQSLKAGVALDRESVLTVKREYFDTQYKEVLDDEKPISIINVSVNPFLQGRGIGDYLLKGFISEHENLAMELFVLSGNRRAISLYEKNGFEIVKMLPGFSLGPQKPECYKMMRSPVVKGNK